VELWRKRNVSTYISFPLTSSTGINVSSASSLDSEYLHWSDLSVPCAFSDMSDETRSIADGIYVLGISAAELNYPYVYIEVKSDIAQTQNLLIVTSVGDPLDPATNAGVVSIMSAIAKVQIDVTSTLAQVAIMSTSVMRDVTSLVVGVTSMMIVTKSALSNTLAILGNQTSCYVAVNSALSNTLAILGNQTSMYVAIRSTWSNTIACGVATQSMISSLLSLDVAQKSIISNIAAVYIDTTSTLANVKLYGASAAINVASLGVNVRSMASHFADMSEDDAGLWRLTANALEQAPSGTGASAATITDAVWSRTMSQMSGVGTAGGLLWSAATAVGGAGETGASIASAVWGHNAATSTIIAIKSTLSNALAILGNQTSMYVAINSTWSNTIAIKASADNNGNAIEVLRINDVSMLIAIRSTLSNTLAINVGVTSLIVNVAQASILSNVQIATVSIAISVSSLLSNVANVDADIVALNNLSAAQVNAEVVDALNVDTYAEPGQEAPAATTTLVKKIGHLYKNWRNRKTVTSTAINIFNDNTVTVDQKLTHSDDGVTYDKGETGSGP
jgi:hypothetical protein